MDKSQSNGLRLSYDQSADVLYLAVGEPRPGIDEEIEPGVFLRLDEKTQRPIGLMIVDFVRRFSRPLTEAIPIRLDEFFVPA